MLFLLDELQRAKIREKILSYPYSKQVDILNYIIKDSLLFDRSGSFNYYVDEVLTSIFSCVSIPLKIKGYKLNCKIQGNKGALCEFASIAGAVCLVINDYILSKANKITFDVNIKNHVIIKISSDGGSITTESEKILNNTALIHHGICLFLKGENSAITLKFPYIKGKALLTPPSPLQLIDDKYSVVRILLHNLF